MSSKQPNVDMKFSKNRHAVQIRNIDGRVELEIDGVVHEVRFLDNGRPYTRTYVNSMVNNVREYAEKFIEFTAAQHAHWAELAKTCAGRESSQ